VDDLALLVELRGALDQPRRAWELVERLGGSLEHDPRHSDYERALMSRLRAAVSEAIAAEREGLNSHHTNASVAITALETSIRKRTTGPDGYKLA